MRQYIFGLAPEEVSSTLPRQVRRIRVPPIKCQGIKTKLVPFIMSSINWEGKGRWIEPFVGSGVVALNVAAHRAYLADSNIHVIRFYRDIRDGVVSAASVRQHLVKEGRLLAKKGGEHYYEVRQRFNNNPTSLDFLFLNRSCFNGLIRFNGKGKFNVPFGKKPERFRKAYVSKIVNQVSHLESVMSTRDWRFEMTDWRDSLAQATENDFVYADPPYAGRHTDYFNKWNAQQEMELLQRLRQLPCGFAFSTWKENKYRRNPLLPNGVPDVTIRTTEHFYHIGPTEKLRNSMTEALVLKKGYAVNESLTPDHAGILSE